MKVIYYAKAFDVPPAVFEGPAARNLYQGYGMWETYI